MLACVDLAEEIWDREGFAPNHRLLSCQPTPQKEGYPCLPPSPCSYPLSATLLSFAAQRCSAGISRAGRPDLVLPKLPTVSGPTLLLIGGGDDSEVVMLNEKPHRISGPWANTTRYLSMGMTRKASPHCT